MAEAVLSAAMNPRGRSARLTVPVIAEFTTQLCLIDKGGFTQRLAEGISGFELYDSLTDSFVEKGIEKSGVTQSALLPFQVKQCIGWMCAKLWEENPGRNAYKEKDCQGLLIKAHKRFSPTCTADELLHIVQRSGIYEAFLLQFRQVCFVHRSLLEFIRAWWMKEQYTIASSGPWDYRDDDFDWTLARLVDRKAWDDQWHETFCFFASFLADHRDEGGKWLVPFLRKIEADDCLIHSRLNLALKCVRQAWFLYEGAPATVPHTDLVVWCSQKRDQLRSMEERCLVSWCFAAWHSGRQLAETDLEVLLENKDLWDPASLSRGFLGFLISRLESAEDPDLRRSLAAAVGSWSVHADSVLLERLISRLESAEDWGVRLSLALAVGSWSVHGDSVLLGGLISRLESEEDPGVRRSLAAAVGSWSVHGDSVLLGGLISRLESAEDPDLRRSLAAAVGDWSVHADSVLLERLISRLESEEDRHVRYSLASAVGCWSVHGDSVLLSRLISRLESKEDPDLRRSLAAAVGSWSVHADSVLLERLISRLESAEDWGVRRSLARAVGSWSVHGDSVLLGGLISRLESAEDEDLRASLAKAVGAWSVHGDSVLLSRLISRLESKEVPGVRRSLAAAVGDWSVHADSVLLERLISRLESEEDRHVRYSLASAVGCWSVHGDSVLLSRLISRLESKEDPDLRRSLAAAVGSWSVHGDEEGFRRLIRIICSEKSVSTLESLVEAMMRWQIGPDGPRRFLPPDHPYFAHPSRQALSAKGVVLVSDLTDMTRED